MPCTVAKHAGFCMGVRQAVEKAERAAAQAQERGIPCYSLGEVVHNPLVTSRLQQLGVQVVERVEDARGGLLILREIEQCETGCRYGNAPWASEQVDDAAAHGFQSGHDA